MPSFCLIISGLALYLTQSLSLALASDESYGCCLIKTEHDSISIKSFSMSYSLS